MGSWEERTLGKVTAGGPSKAADCGAGRPGSSWPSRQQLVDRVADHTTQGSSMGKQSLKPLNENTRGG